MKYFRLTGAETTDQSITDRHFGSNIIGTRYTQNGAIVSNFMEAIDELGVTDLRYPAGQPDVVYEEGLLQNGRLPVHVENFLNDLVDRPGKVTMVTPTFGSYGGPDELRQFAELVLTKYGNKILSFEIGNEHWQYQTEAEYGAIANESALAIQAAIESTGVDTQVWVQMANAAGGSSAFKQHPTLGWEDSTIEANKAIIAELSDEALDIIDGTVEHAYLRETGQLIGDETEATNMAHLDLQVWKEQTGRDFDFIVSEWNVRTTNLDQLGARGASSLLHHFDNLIKLEADSMQIWSAQHNTATDLAGADKVLLDSDTGIVKNTTIGAVFDLMSTSLIGKDRLEIETDNSDQHISKFAFADENEVVIYISSRSEEIENISFSLGEVYPMGVLTSAYQLGYDKGSDSSDGMHWSTEAKAFVRSDYIIVDGQNYYLNEHDANAEIATLDVQAANQSGEIQFRLLPYEIVELTYSIAGNTATLGSDVLNFDVGAQAIYSLSGNDSVNVGVDNDTVFGGSGHDHIVLGAGDDLGDGGDGNDFLSGWGGNDSLFGQDGTDTLHGFAGNDVIDGGSGNDSLRGDGGADVLLGSSGFDTLVGGDGTDRLEGGSHADVLAGNDDNDTLIGGGGVDQLDGGSGDDLLYGGDDADTIHAGVGNDTVFGDSGADRLFGNAGFDTLSGGDGNDYLDGENQADVVWGGGGDDTLLGGAGVDILYGGEGSDQIDAGIHNDRAYGGVGNDTIYGGAGFDLLVGGTGNDLVEGGNEADRIFGGAGQDRLSGQSGVDYLFGGDGADYVDGGSDDDTVLGGDGEDTLAGGDGQDRILAGEGSDIIEGGQGNDTIHGNSGFDTVIGGFGNDVMFGDFNADEFVFHDSHGHDIIEDFEENTLAERINLEGVSSFSDFASIENSMFQSGNDVVVQTSQQSSIRIKNVELGDLDENDFIF